VSQTTIPCPTCGQGRVAAVCTCSHTVYAHNLNGKNERTACSAYSGPTAVKCPCRSYQAAEVSA
jgi:hypothetical protein